MESPISGRDQEMPSGTSCRHDCIYEEDLLYLKICLRMTANWTGEVQYGEKG